MTVGSALLGALVTCWAMAAAKMNATLVYVISTITTVVGVMKDALRMILRKGLARPNAILKIAISIKISALLNQLTPKPIAEKNQV